MNWKRTLIALFFTSVALMSALTFAMPKEKESELENRTLASPPKLSAENILNKSFMDDTESYLTDYVFGRTAFVKAKTKLELLQGKSEINGVYITDKRLLQKEDLSGNATANNIAAINNFAANHSGLDVSIMLAPTALGIYPNDAPIYSQNNNQLEYINNVYESLRDVRTVDCYTPLSSVSNEYIYYRTDHHWTSRGAYTAYNAMAKTLGFKAPGIESFNIEHAAHDFLGTLYSKALYGEELQDVVDIYHYTEKSTGDVTVIKYTGEGKQTSQSVLFREELKEKDKYQVFMGENVPVATIKTDVKNGQKIVIFKDSYANSIMQFLQLNYEEITLVDLRYLNQSVEKYINLEDYSQAMFLYNVSSFANDNVVMKLNVFS